MRHLSLTSILIGCLLCLMTACVTQTQKVDEPVQKRDDKGLPQQVLRVPQQMQDLSGELLRYHARYRILPPTLKTLVDDKIMTPQQFAELPDYLYEPSDKYKLRDGRTVIVVDSEVRIEGHAWCIVREPGGAPPSIQLNVTPVSLAELEAAAKQ